MIPTRWRPPREIVLLRDALDRLFEESFFWPHGWMAPRLAGIEAIPLDIYEEGNNLVVKAPLPGVKPEDLNVQVRENLLTISGEVKRAEERKEESYYLREQRYDRFERSVTLPSVVRVDKAEAEFENGILTLTLPKVEETRAVKIQVKAKK